MAPSPTAAAQAQLNRDAAGAAPWRLLAEQILGRPWRKDWAQPFVSEKTEEADLLKRSGEPRRTRTCNPLIKSQLLYH